MNLGLGKIVYEAYNNFPQKGHLEFDELNHSSIKAWDLGAMAIVNAIIKEPIEINEKTVDDFGNKILALNIEEIESLLLSSSFNLKLVETLDSKGFIKSISDLKFCIANPDSHKELIKEILLFKLMKKGLKEKNILMVFEKIDFYLDKNIIDKENLNSFLQKIKEMMFSDKKIREDSLTIKAFIIKLSGKGEI